MEEYKISILPITAIYGGNASGKTALFKALNFMQRFVVKGSVPDELIPVNPFRLDELSLQSPTRFSIELLATDTIYAFEFATTSERVVEEKLVRINRASETILYDRQGTEPNFAAELRDNDLLKFAFQGTRNNQLFLTNTVIQNIDLFRPVYNWFSRTLQMIAPDTRFQAFEQFIDEDSPLHGVMSEVLHSLDTGISRLGGEDTPFGSELFPNSIQSSFSLSLPPGKYIRLNLPQGKQFIVSNKGSELIAKKLVTYHQTQSGGEERFELGEESDGTQRLIDLLPRFIDLAQTKAEKVYVIDELDRSLHSILTRHLLESYLDQCGPDRRTQILFTTHDVLLMDQDLLRRDEMWITERKPDGNTTLIPFSDFKDIRYDKDIRKSYLQGRMGGIPKILIRGITEGSLEDDK